MSETKTTAPQPASGQKLVTELKVSGHLMTFDAGLFCIFTPPGGPASDPQTGLPGIRISLPPGPAFRPDAVNISTFRDDGWLGGWNGAALVRVSRGPAQVMVTIYQAPNSKGEAPKLQIMRLTEGQPAPAAAQASSDGKAIAAAPVPAAPAAIAAPATAISAPAMSLTQNTPPGGAKATDAAHAEIVAHVQSRGDVVCALSDWMGVADSKHWIEGFAVSPKQMIGPGDIEYQAVLGRGWLSPWAEGGQFCGSRGMSLPILGLRVRLRGDAAERFDCALCATFVDGTKLGPIDNGEPCQADSLAPLEAFRIDIKPRESEANTGDATPSPKASAAKTMTGKTSAGKTSTAAATASKSKLTPVKPEESLPRASKTAPKPVRRK